jgi:glycosyltransferase involved in cell wall biosynthesis
MIVAHMVTSLGGGAGIATARIHRGVAGRNIDSRLFVADPRSLGGDALLRPMRTRGPVRQLAYRVALKLYTRGRPPAAGVFSYTSLPAATPFPFDLVRPDVIHLHWIAQGFDYGSLFASIPDGLPVVWTLHDAEPFSGGCHSALTCRRFEARCGRCPQLNGLRNPWDLSAITCRRKRRWYRRLDLHAVAVSRSIARDAGASATMAGARSITVIPNGVDLERFMPHDSNAARARLGVPRDRFVVVFGAVEPDNRLKGGWVLAEALARMRNRDRVFLLVFGGPLAGDFSFGGAEWRHLGYLGEPHQLAEAYSAADVFALPSLAEPFGQVGIEALACGTPVVGSRVGGIPDFVHDGENGLLVEPGDASELAQRLDWLIEHPDAVRRFGANGPPLVRERFSSGSVAEQYAALYHRITAEAER